MLGFCVKDNPVRVSKEGFSEFEALSWPYHLRCMFVLFPARAHSSSDYLVVHPLAEVETACRERSILSKYGK